MKSVVLIVAYIVLFLNISLGQSSAMISGGMYHSIYLCDNGNVFSWGDNSFGQLGRNIELNEDLTPRLVINLNNIKTVCAAKGNFSLAIKQDGSLWSWGQNTQWQLGSDTACVSFGECDYASTPVQVKGGETGHWFLKNVIDCAAGLTQSYALLSTGEVVSWGDNYHGQLGNGTTQRSKEPVFVKKQDGTKLTNIASIAAGALFAFAITNDGRVWGWGKNTEYELGCGNNQNQLFATEILDKNALPLDNIASISCGLKHALFLSKQGHIYGTGAFKGETWINGVTYYKVQMFATLFSEISNVKKIACGLNHNAAMAETNNGVLEVFTWGNNKYFPMTQPISGGQLGINNENILTSIYPLQVKNNLDIHLSNISSVYCSNFGTYIKTFNNTTKTNCLYVTGINTLGQLGTRTHVDEYAMVKISLPQCNSNCPTAFLGNNKILCTPIIDTLKSGYTGSNYSFRWFKNDVLLSNETKTNLSISGKGLYTIEITDTVKACSAVSDEIYLQEKTPTFTILKSQYCGDTVTFKTFNNDMANWYSQRLFGKYLGSGAIISVSKEELSTSLPDSAKTIWMYTPECQPIPIVSEKKCDACNLTPPIVDFKNQYCIDSSIVLTASGNTIHWYNSDMSRLLSVNKTLTLDSSYKASYSFNVTQTDLNCESKATSITTQVQRCYVRYRVEGYVLPPQKADIVLYDYNRLPLIIAQKETDNDGVFSFEVIDKTNIAIQAKPKDVEHYSPTYFGNTDLISKAVSIKVDAHVSHLEIGLLTKTKEYEQHDSFTKVYPSIVENYLIFDQAQNQFCEVQIYDNSGKLITTFQTHDISTLVIVKDFPKGTYFYKALCADRVAETGSFIKR